VTALESARTRIDACIAAAVLLGSVLLLAAGIHLQSLVHINHDVGWIAHSAAWLLDGRKFGTDILDPNPPLAWFLMLPAVIVARAGWLTEVVAIQAWSWLLTIAGLSLAAAVLVRINATLGRIESAGFLLSAAAVLALLPVGNFGQREIIAFALILPYLLLLAGRTQEAPVPGRALALLVGIGAGIGICLKPFLVVVPILAELVNLALTRRLHVLIRTETVVMAIAVAAYAAAILVFARDYLDFALPLIRSVYWAYDDPGYFIASRFREAAMPAAWALGIALATWSFTRTHAVLIAALAGFSLAYWVQNKGFPYHAYPVLAGGCVLLAYSGIRAFRAILASRWLVRRPLRLLAVLALLAAVLPPLYEPFSKALFWYQAADRNTGDWGRLRQEPIDRLRALGIDSSDYIFALSTHPHPGFPTVNYLGVQWAGRAVSQFAIPAYARRDEIQDPAQRAAIERAASLQVSIVIEDLRTNRPKYVMVEARQRRLGLGYRHFDDLAFYGREPEFVRLWSCYEELAPMDQIRLFRRRIGC